MKEKIIGKRYYRITFQLASALSVGGTVNENTDRDIVRDSRNMPYIPATALAGIYRSFLPPGDIKKYFGYIDKMGTENQEGKDSRFLIYDANLAGGDFQISGRDCVALDEWKTAKKRAKFDFEILEPGATFVTYIEQNKWEGDENAGDYIANAWKGERVVIGGKTSRGLGKTCNAIVDVLEFPMGGRGKDKENVVEDWLDFCMYDDASWKKAAVKYAARTEALKGYEETRGLCLNLQMEQAGPIAIRTYTTEAGEDQPDYQQLVYIQRTDNGEQETPVIPGTSWAGAFRHQMEKLNKSCIRDYFGIKSEKKSRIIFGESEITQAYSKEFTRNAIDRFTGGAAERALFKEKVFYGGRTSLDIIVEGKEIDNDFIRCLAAAVTDLHLGFLSVGGETAVGRGLFRLTGVKVQGKEGNINWEEGGKLYQGLLECMIRGLNEGG